MLTAFRFVVAFFALCVSFVASVRAEDVPDYRAKGDLALQSRDILQRYCAECHTGVADVGKSKLAILDHAQLTAKRTPVPFVAPAGRSLLLDLIKDGSMPPANKPAPTQKELETLEKWVNSQAPAFPTSFDDDAVLTIVADDFEKQDAKIKNGVAAQTLRYVSFAHLIRDGQPLPDLLAAERELAKALAWHLKNLTPVDPAGTVFRVDLGYVGWWTRELFDRVERRKPAGVVPVRPYDLFLLEYPFARNWEESDTRSKKLEKLLAKTAQVRPIPFVRGDWLTAAILNGKMGTPLVNEAHSLAALEKSFGRGGKAIDGPPATPFANAKSYTPADDSSILPLNAWYLKDIAARTAPFTLNAEIVSQGKVVTEVAVDEPFMLRVSADRKVHFVVLLVEEDGEIRLPEVTGGTLLQPHRERLLAPNGTAFTVSSILSGGNSATQHFVLFACESELPLPTLIRSQHADNHMWRFLIEPTEKYRFNPNAVVRKVIPVKVNKKP
jgi:mono/diheme cytochrome c family protein